MAGATSEYQRLSEELERLAVKNAWVGAERTFQELVATGVPLAFDDWLRGGQAARARGDIRAAAERFKSANSLQEDREIIDLLWDIDRRFGAVDLVCDPEDYLALEADASPLDPDLLRAIEFAKAEIHDRCAFRGLLPLGSYRLHDRAVIVEAHRSPVQLDLRDEVLDRRTRRKNRESWARAEVADPTGASAP